jgi:hypothetical protein
VGRVLVGVGVVLVGVGVGVAEFVGVADFVAVGVLAGVFEGASDFVAVVPVAPPTTPVPGLPMALTGRETVTPGLLCAVAPDWVWVGSVVLLPTLFKVELLLLEISTAMIATTPMAAAPMPAIKKDRFPLPRGAGSRSGAPS